VSERYYGLKLGDLVTYPAAGSESRLYLVVNLSPLDNNRVYLQAEDDPKEEPFRAVAEWCRKTGKA
jgi:hypothetical protein